MLGALKKPQQFLLLGLFLDYRATRLMVFAKWI